MAKRHSKSVSSWLTFACSIAMLGLLWAAPRLSVMAIPAAAVPWVAIWFARRNASVYRLLGRADTGQIDLFWVFGFPTMVFGFVAYLDLPWLAWPRLSLGVLVAGATLLAGALFADSRLRTVTRSTLWLALIVVAYGVGVAGFANALLDGPPIMTYRVPVLNAQPPLDSRDPSWTLELAPWGPRQAVNSVTVSTSVYSACRRAGIVCIKAHPGALGVEWYSVDRCE